jgi:endonuclease VIII
MPEGPSIVILKEELLPFKGKKVLAIAGNSKIDLQRLKGLKLLDVMSWGKNLILVFKGFFLKFHLLMFGRYTINERKEAAPRIRLEFASGEFSFYNCSVRIIEGRPEDHYDWSADTMSADWDQAKALKKMRGRKELMICDGLLEQDIFAGVGNIIKNEALWLSRIHPEALIGDLPAKKLREVTHTTREYCFDFYRWKKVYELKKHYQVYNKAICPRCQLKLLRKHTGLKKRRSFFCGNCQLLYDQ